jgi:anaphase-promoting complex subunit 4
MQGSLLIVIETLGATFIATAGYNDLGYQELRPEGYVIIPTREDLMLEAMQQWKDGHVSFMILLTLPRLY